MIPPKLVLNLAALLNYVIPAQAGTQFKECRDATHHYWIPAYAGMTTDARIFNSLSLTVDSTPN